MRGGKGLAALCAAVLLSGCQTYRAYIPEMAEQRREGLTLTAPVILAIFDGRAEKAKSSQLISHLREGLGQAEVVRTATENYRREQDVIADFLQDCCILDPPSHRPEGGAV